MKRNTWTIIAAAALATAAAPTPAADDGFYLAAALGHSEERPESIGINVAAGFPPAGIVHIEPVSTDVDESGTGWSAALGYRIRPHLVAELEYLVFGATHIDEHYRFDLPIFPLPLELDHGYSSKVTGPALSLLGSLPAGKRFEMFLRAGVLFADRKVSVVSPGAVEETFASTVWIGGVGAKWLVSHRWAVRAEYQQTGKLGETSLAGETDLRRVALSALVDL